MAKEIQRQTDQGTGVIGARVARLQLAISGLLGKSPSLRSNLATLAVAWAAFATLELALYVLMPRTALHSHDLPVGARILLFCYSLTVLTFFLLLAGAAIMATVSSCWRFFPDRRGVRVVARLLIALPIWLLLIFYGASWGLFWQTGSFIGTQVFIFMAPHPLQVFHWVDFDIAFTIVAAAGAGAFALTLIPRWTARQSRISQETLIRSWQLGDWLIRDGSFLGQSL